MARCWHRGRHSQLPRCCVAWFVLVRMHLPHAWLELQLRWRLRWLAEQPPERAYARCPACLVRGRWARQHLCTAECAGQRGGTPPRTRG